MEIYRTEPINNGLVKSLNTIRVVNARRHLLATSISTAAILGSQIELCEVLLREIRTIRSSLRGRIESRCWVSRRSVFAERDRSGGRLTVLQSDRPNNSN
jgi:hypothetical protein